MTASELIAELRSREVVLSLSAPDRLHVNAPERFITPWFIESLRQYKADIIAELSDEDARRREFYSDLARNPDAWREFETQMAECAAIMEFDGGLSRDEATALAEVMTVDGWVN